MKHFDRYVNPETDTNTSSGTFNNKATAIEQKYSGSTSIDFVQKTQQKLNPTPQPPTNGK